MSQTKARKKPGVVRFFEGIAEFFTSTVKAFVEGDIFVKLSALLCGTSCFARKQYLKGFFICLIQAAIMLVFPTFFFPYMSKLSTLGTVQQKRVFNPETMKNEFNDYDNSFLILLFGVLGVVLLIATVILWMRNLRNAREVELTAKSGKHVNTFRDDLNDALDRKFHRTLLTLPVLGVVVVARFDGLEKLGRQVGKRFALVFAVLIYLSIGPGLGIPRAASVPFEMAVAPYLPENSNAALWMAAYSLVFFLVALWLCLNPGKLVDRIGRGLTPVLLVLLTLLFACFLFRGETQVAPPQESYAHAPLLKGFTEGYNTMDTIAALNFGLVISTTLGSFGLEQKRDKMRYTVRAGLLAGTILALVYAMLSYMGMCSSGVYEIQENGAWTLRCIVYQVFGSIGAVLLAAIFTLACLTTCVGLINSISQYFSMLFQKVSYRAWVYIITFFSFLVCNLGLSMILSISIPVLNAIYPVAIVLILLGLSHDLWKNNRFAYPMTVAGTAVVSVLFALGEAGVPLGGVNTLLHGLPMYKLGFGWVSVAAAMLLLSLAVNALCRGCKSEQTVINPGGE